jgi:hypothetical protein
VVPPPKLVHSEIPIPEHSYSTRLEALEVGPGRYCSPRHAIPNTSINEGSKYGLMMRRALSGRPEVQDVRYRVSVGPRAMPSVRRCRLTLTNSP